MNTTTPITDGLRSAVRASGLTSYEIAKRGGFSPSILTRFLRQDRSLTLVIADRLAAVLGLQLVPSEITGTTVFHHEDAPPHSTGQMGDEDDAGEITVTTRFHEDASKPPNSQNTPDFDGDPTGL